MNTIPQIFKRHGILLTLCGVIAALPAAFLAQETQPSCFCDKFRYEIRATGLETQLVEFTDPGEGEEFSDRKEYIFAQKEFTIILPNAPDEVFASAFIYPSRIFHSVHGADNTPTKKCAREFKKGWDRITNLIPRSEDPGAQYRIEYWQDNIYDKELGIGYGYFGPFKVADKDAGMATWEYKGTVRFNPEPVYHALGTDPITGEELYGSDEIETNCWPATCKCPVKITWLWPTKGGELVDISPLKYMPSGKGNTTGPVVDVAITNPTDQNIAGVLGPYVIPASGKYQGYVIPEEHPYLAPAGTSITVTLEGKCTDIHRPAVETGAAVTRLSDWISKDEAGSVPTPEKALSRDDGFIPVSDPGNQPVQIFYPDTTVPFNYTIDINKYPEAAASLLFHTVDVISETYDSLYEKGVISTPFSDDPDKQKATSEQHTLWMYTSALSGDPYAIEDLDENLEKQFTVVTSRKPTEEEEAGLTEGGTILWNTFSMLGDEAKVLKAATTYYNCYSGSACQGTVLERVTSAGECENAKGSSISTGIQDHCLEARKDHPGMEHQGGIQN